MSNVSSAFFCIGLPLYDPSKDFTCLDGSQLLSFSSVNDDYCDCTDGSDEPGNGGSKYMVFPGKL